MSGLISYHIIFGYYYNIYFGYNFDFNNYRRRNNDNENVYSHTSDEVSFMSRHVPGL